jgi:formylglycine-generating enzyme required for sulfatase activity
LALSILGDPRAGVGLTADALPEIAWCAVGTSGLHLAIYPVTHAQFKAFYDAPDGYADDNWWQGLSHGKQLWKNTVETLNAPADNVAWVNAIAFCRWLNTKAAVTTSIAQAGYEIRIPTESEWLQAAIGDHADYVYPWGAEWLPLHANSRETALNRAVSVGLFPEGTSPCGALDMVGNTWEWCLNAAEGAVAGMERRAMSGGSYLDAPNSLTVTTRLYQHPLSRNPTSGFRLAYAPIL